MNLNKAIKAASPSKGKGSPSKGKGNGFSKGKGSPSKGNGNVFSKGKGSPSKGTSSARVPPTTQPRMHHPLTPPIDRSLGVASTTQPRMHHPVTPPERNHHVIPVGLAMETSSQYSAVGESRRTGMVTFSTKKISFLFVLCMVCVVFFAVIAFRLVSNSADSSNEVHSSESTTKTDLQSLQPQPAVNPPQYAESLSPLARSPRTNGPLPSTDEPSQLIVSPTDHTGSPTDKSASPTDRSESPTDHTGSPTDKSASPTKKTNSPQPPQITTSPSCPCQVGTIPDPQINTSPRAPAQPSGGSGSGVTDRVDKLEAIKSIEGSWGSWSNWKYCASGSYATGFYLKLEPYQGGDDDTSANGFRLICNDGDELSAGNDGRWGGWTKKECNGGQAIKGFTTQVEGKQGGNDDTALNSVRAYCTDNVDIAIESEGKFGTWDQHPNYCPPGSIVCGFRQKVEPQQGSDDDTALNAIELMCCPSKKSYSNGKGFWERVYTGNNGLSYTETITYGIENYKEAEITQENGQSLEKTLAMNMGFEYQGMSAGASAELKSTVSSVVTRSSVSSTLTTQLNQKELSCSSNGCKKYYGLYQFFVSANENAFNQDPFTFKIRSKDFWCSEVPNQAPKCPPGYCNHCDNCQTCVADIH